jgi:regulator of cell morphogenesis and NO signaling
MMTNGDFDLSLKEIVQIDYRAAEVFKKFKLSFCCGGNMSLKSACDLKQLNYATIMDELSGATRNIQVSNQLPFHSWKTDFLIDFIMHLHHEYIYQTAPALNISLQSFSVGHSKKYPEFTHITELFSQLSNMLMVHNRHEDEIIFPYIKQMDAAHRRKEAYANLFVRTLRKPLHNIEREHEQISKLMDGLRSAANDFSFSTQACSSYQVLIQRLKEFYDNLVQHKFLEHKILFPKALTIEQQLLQL